MLGPYKCQVAKIFKGFAQISLGAFKVGPQTPPAPKLRNSNLCLTAQVGNFWLTPWLWPIIMQAYISRSGKTFFSKLCSMTGHNNLDKNQPREISKKNPQKSWLWPKIMQAFTSGSVLRIFFQSLQHDRAQQVDENHLSEIS